MQASISIVRTYARTEWTMYHALSENNKQYQASNELCLNSPYLLMA